MWYGQAGLGSAAVCPNRHLLDNPPMGIDWAEIVKTLGGGAVLLGIAGWLIRSIVTHQLDRDNAAFRNQLQHDSSAQVEALKNDLKRQSDIEIERLKNSLQIAALEHQVRFTMLHTQRLEAIPKLNESLADAITHVRNYVLMQQRDSDSLKRAVDAATDFRRIVYVNGPVLPAEVSKLLEGISDKFVRLVVMTKGFYLELPGEVPSPEVLVLQHKILDEAASAFEKEIPELQKTLTEKLRGLLAPVTEKET
jgi:hypothetical protein